MYFFYDGSNYHYQFINNELANEIERQFECIGENKEKCKTFSVSIKKEITKIDKGDNEGVVNISYKIKFIDSVRSLLSLVNTLAEVIHKI